MMITRKRIDLSHHVAGLQHTGAGAWALFAGNVRDNHRGRAVAYLHYEAMLPLAERMIREIVEAAVSEFGLLHGLHILKSKHTKACKLNVCGLFVFYSILIHSIIRIKTVSNSVSQFPAYLYSLETL